MHQNISRQNFYPAKDQQYVQQQQQRQRQQQHQQTMDYEPPGRGSPVCFEFRNYQSIAFFVHIAALVLCGINIGIIGYNFSYYKVMFVHTV